MEGEYLQSIAKHTEGPRGKRGVDTIAQMFGNLVNIMEKTSDDVLGDLFQGAITYGERGQFLTPESLCQAMIAMNVPSEKTGIEGRRTVFDPCCGSGRILSAAAEVQPNWQFVGQDIDLCCVRMTAINLALRNRHGHVAWGDTLRLETKLTYETGRLEVFGNVIRKVGRISFPDHEPEVLDTILPAGTLQRPQQHDELTVDDEEPGSPPSQLQLF